MFSKPGLSLFWTEGEELLQAANTGCVKIPDHTENLNYLYYFSLTRILIKKNFIIN